LYLVEYNIRIEIEYEAKIKVIYKLLLRRKFMGKYVPTVLVVIWVIIIFSFSFQDGDVSQGYSLKAASFLQRSLGFIGDFDEDTLHYFVRKAAHVVLYFVLTLLVMNALHWGGFKGRGLVIRTLAISFFYACMDEIIQRYVEGRSVKPQDVFIDGFGIILGIILGKILKILLLKRVNREM